MHTAILNFGTTIKSLFKAKLWLTLMMVTLGLVLLYSGINELKYYSVDATNLIRVSRLAVNDAIKNLDEVALTQLSQGDLVAISKGSWQDISEPNPRLHEPMASESQLLKVDLAINDLKTPILHLKRVYGGSYGVFDEKFNLLGYYPVAPEHHPYSHVINESYTHIPENATVVYLLIAGNVFNGPSDISNMSRVETFDQLGSNGFDISSNRYSFAILLTIVAISLFVFSLIFKRIESYRLIRALAAFIGLFSLWTFLDFPRYGYWVIHHFNNVPIPLLYFIFIVASNLMTPAFVYLNFNLLVKQKHRQAVKILFYLTLTISVATLLVESIKFFTWNSGLDWVFNGLFDLQSMIITLGSMILIVVAILDLPYQKRNGYVYITGLVTCLATFVVSQITPYLISHWGVLWLLISIVTVMALSFLEAQDKKREYLEQLVTTNKQMEILNQDLELTQSELLLRLGGTVDLRSKETSSHVQRVSTFTQIIAEAIGYAPEEAKTLAMASTLHDIGKVGIPDRILNEPGKLSKEDFEAMKQHAIMGFEILNGSYNHLLDIAAIVALTHHEKYDGTGYPYQLSGDDIPMHGSIVAASDVFDALLSKRVYKPAWTFEQVLDFFKFQSGLHFHPEVVKVLLANQEAILAAIETLPYEE